MKIIDQSHEIISLPDNLLQTIKVADNWREFKCIVDGCNRNVGVRKEGLCPKHYDQKRHTGRITRLIVTDLNEIVTNGDVSKIILRDNRNKNIAETIIDSEDVKKVKNYKWALYKKYAYSKQAGYLHRLILGHSGLIDHINRNPLDNRKTNLRPTNCSKNSANSGIHSNSTSGFKGVSFFKKTGSWRAYIIVNGKFLSLGYYSTPKEAAIAYDTAAIKHFQEHATTNKDLKLL
jgi:hypothetical protein